MQKVNVSIILNSSDHFWQNWTKVNRFEQKLIVPRDVILVTSHDMFVTVRAHMIDRVTSHLRTLNIRRICLQPWWTDRKWTELNGTKKFASRVFTCTQMTWVDRATRWKCRIPLLPLLIISFTSSCFDVKCDYFPMCKMKKVEKSEKIISCRTGSFWCENTRHLHANPRANHVMFDLYVTTCAHMHLRSSAFIYIGK